LPSRCEGLFNDRTDTFKSIALKGQCHEIFSSGFFHESVSPQPQSIPLDRFEFFRKFAEIFASQGTPPVSTTLAAKLPPVSTTPAANFATSFASVVDTGGKFAAGVNATGGNLPPVSKTPAANLPPVSMTPVANNGNNIRLLRP
jgi:hypothetical protein